MHAGRALQLAQVGEWGTVLAALAVVAMVVRWLTP